MRTRRCSFYTNSLIRATWLEEMTSCCLLSSEYLLMNADLNGMNGCAAGEGERALMEQDVLVDRMRFRVNRERYCVTSTGL